MSLSSVEASLARGVLLLVVGLFFVFPLAYAQPPGNTPLWSTPDEVADLALSADGSVVVISNFTHVKVFDGFGNLLWQYNMPGYYVYAVDVSYDGNSVAASFYNYTFSYVLFWRDASSLAGEPPPTWSSMDLGGPIYGDALAVSGDGNHVAAVGTGPSVFYWRNAPSLSGSGVMYTWGNFTGMTQLEYVDLSYDGDYLVTVGTLLGTEAWLFYFEGATTKSGSVDADLALQLGVGSLVDVSGLAMSDDGRYAVVGYYNSLTGWSIYYYDFFAAPYSYWESELGDVIVGNVDISSDGATVVATLTLGIPGFSLATAPIKPDYHEGYQLMDLAGPLSNISFYFVPAGFPNESMLWPDVNVSVDDVLDDVSLSGDGSVAVAGSVYGDAVYAASSSGTLLWYNQSTTVISTYVEISHNGNVAIAGGNQVDSLYYFLVRPQVSIVGGEASLRLSGLDTSLRAYMAIAALAIVSTTYMLYRITRRPK